MGDAVLKKAIHSVKWRVKEPSHLRDKLVRRAVKATAENAVFAVTKDNLFDSIHDLAGVRLLHLHMKQVEIIHPRLVQFFSEEGYIQHEPPEAKTWDLEYEKLLIGLGLSVKRDESLYTSIHYKVRQNSTNPRTCELQVRTLAEEVWGEVSHTINYPHPTESVACKEQLKALARFVSGCSRLVDSIVASHEDHNGRISPTQQ
ncbi:MAG: RelA/SpoT domain-containing protein [Phycisphaerales bacterium]